MPCRRRVQHRPEVRLSAAGKPVPLPLTDWQLIDLREKFAGKSCA